MYARARARAFCERVCVYVRAFQFAENACVRGIVLSQMPVAQCSVMRLICSA